MLKSYHVTAIVPDDNLAEQLRRAEELQARFYVQSEQFRSWQQAYYRHMEAYYTRKVDYHERMISFYKSHLSDGAALHTSMAPPKVEAGSVTRADDDKDITDEQWMLVAPLLPLGNGRGRPYIDDRRTLNGVLYVTAHHVGWSHMPARYGSYVTCWRRYLRWQSKGIWQQVLSLLQHETDDVLAGDGQGERAIAIGGMVHAKRRADLTSNL